VEIALTPSPAFPDTRLSVSDTSSVPAPVPFAWIPNDGESVIIVRKIETLSVPPPVGNRLTPPPPELLPQSVRLESEMYNEDAVAAVVAMSTQNFEKCITLTFSMFSDLPDRKRMPL